MICFEDWCDTNSYLVGLRFLMDNLVPILIALFAVSVGFQICGWIAEELADYLREMGLMRLIGLEKPKKGLQKNKGGATNGTRKLN